jgi:hypothetical protein
MRVLDYKCNMYFLFALSLSTSGFSSPFWPLSFFELLANHRVQKHSTRLLCCMALESKGGANCEFSRGCLLIDMNFMYPGGSGNFR